jgi:hypothetical protein
MEMKDLFKSAFARFVYCKEQLEAIKYVLQKCGNWDPTESYADLIEDLRTTGELLTSELSQRRREISYLKSELQALKLEKNHEKAVARSYPLSNPVDIGGSTTYSHGRRFPKG